MNPSFLKEVSAGYAGGTQVPPELLLVVAAVTEVAIALTTPGTVLARPGLAVIPRAIPSSPYSSPRPRQSGQPMPANGE
jgi:hypothetical protein